jgi:hypothetical protein
MSDDDQSIKSNRIPLQLDQDETAKLDELSARLSTTRNQTIRLLIQREISEPRIAIPEPRSGEIFRVAEGEYGETTEIRMQNGRALHFYVAPYRNRCCVLLLDPELTETVGYPNYEELYGDSEILDAILDLRETKYDWDDPRYRSICKSLDIDPDEKRPQFVKEFAGIARGLMNRQARFDYSSPHWELLLDLVDLLRSDIQPTLQMLNRAKERFDTLSSKERADVYRQAITAAESRKLPSEHRLTTDIVFLPSWTDCYWNKRVGIWESKQCDDDGWTPDYNRDLQGVAVLPSGKLSDVQAIIVQKLREQGVIFLNEQEAQEYLHNEGAYWAWKNLTIRKIFDGHHGARKPTTSEKMKWRILKPETPLYDRWFGRMNRAA